MFFEEFLEVVGAGRQDAAVSAEFDVFDHHGDVAVLPLQTLLVEQLEEDVLVLLVHILHRLGHLRARITRILHSSLGPVLPTCVVRGARPNFQMRAPSFEMILQITFATKAQPSATKCTKSPDEANGRSRVAGAFASRLRACAFMWRLWPRGGFADVLPRGSAFSGHSGFVVAHSKGLHVRLIETWKLSIGVDGLGLRICRPAHSSQSAGM